MAPDRVLAWPNDMAGQLVLKSDSRSAAMLFDALPGQDVRPSWPGSERGTDIIFDSRALAELLRRQKTSSRADRPSADGPLTARWPAPKMRPRMVLDRLGT
jgi:hypothetical protein